MTLPDGDSIAAIATAPGAAGIGIVRISGPAALDLQRTLTGHQLAPNQARYLPVYDRAKQVLDQAVVVYFAAPHSFTGEHVLELQGHGGPVIMQMLLQRVFELGVRPAGPGEFSQRAFLNNKLDLAQAEAIADLINASTETAARAATRSLAGEFSLKVSELLSDLTELRVFVESAIDFPTEEIDFLGEAALDQKLAALNQSLSALTMAAKNGAALRDGLTLAIVGPPNAGKSSLLNALSGRDSAIVTNIPGTTRDVLREQIHIEGVPIHLVDTAGLRDSDDTVEREGIRRAMTAVDSADHVLVMVDDSNPDSAMPQLPESSPPQTLVRNKIDQSGASAKETSDSIWLSVKTADGLDLLRQRLLRLAGTSPVQGGQFSARTRHLNALDQVAEHLHQATSMLGADLPGELLAEELRLAQNCLADITGEFLPDDLLGEIFSSFCIGK
ncbi:MAG: tRNA uridine-5-carboxymethylaminomethyl(34) synthesis GTPase MnmE [Lysobacterales bacterium]